MSSPEQLLESKQCLSHCLGNPILHALPVLIVCSKNDLPAAIPVRDVSKTGLFYVTLKFCLAHTHTQVEEVIKDELDGRKWIILSTGNDSVEETKKELEDFVDLLIKKPPDCN